MKKCFKCGVEKEITDFYKHPQMKDGHLNKCKLCTKKDVKEDYSKNIVNADFKESEQARGREKYRRLYAGSAKADIKRNIAYAKKYPEKLAAKSYSANLDKPFENVERHHWSYNEEHYTDVIWLSKKEHMKGHRFIVYDQERKMYRRFDNNELLDTKEKHSQFISSCIKNKTD